MLAKSKVWLVVVVILTTLPALSACSDVPVEPQEAAPELADSGGVMPPTFIQTEIGIFSEYLTNLFQDPNRINQELIDVMSDPFMIGGWQAGASTMSPTEAMGELMTTHLSTEGGVRDCYDTVEWEALLGTDVETMFPEAANLLLCEGWGFYGDDEAIIIIEQGSDDLYYWAGIVAAAGGFPPPTADLEYLTTYLIGLLQDPGRDQAQLEGALLDPFTFVGFGPESQMMSPSDAMGELYEWHLSTEGGVSQCDYPIDREVILLSPVGAMIPEARRYVHCMGWGFYGDTEALLTIDQGSDGLYYWSSVSVLEGGLPVPSADLEVFTTYLISLLQDPNRDRDLLEATLLDPFTFVGFGMPSEMASPADAMTELYELHLSTEGGVSECFYPIGELELSSSPVGEMIPEATRLVFCQGWGIYGDTWAILTIDLGSDGLYHWSGVAVLEAPLAFG